MRTFIARYRHPLFRWSLALTCFVLALLLLDYNRESIGVCFLSYALVIPVYWGIRHWWLREPSKAWLLREELLMALLFGLFCQIGAIALHPDAIGGTLLLAELSVLVPLLVRRYGQASAKRLSRFWLLIIVVTIAWLTIAAYEGEELLFLMFFLYLLIGLVLGVRWLIKQIRLIATIKKEKTIAELRHLQSQVNPHFFFNILNTLYGLVKKDAAKAEALILQLSDMMRYSIYEGQNERVSLAEELQYLQQYIELQQMRYKKSVDVQLEYEDNVEGVEIMPLMLVILVENAFKHGVEPLRANAYVFIDLQIQGKQMVFTVRNNFDPEEVTTESGIGLKNLQRRLALAYPDQHKLELEQAADTFHAQLTIESL